MGICLTLLRSVISAGRSVRGRAQPAAARSSAMGSLAPPLAVRAGATAEGAAPSEEQPALQQQKEQRQRREKQPRPPPPPRPTHFLALQVSDHPGVAAAIATVQASLCRHSPHLKKACVKAASAHLTLGVMALSSEAERARAAVVLAALAEPLRKASLLAPVRVRLEGLSHFKNQVLYLDVRPDDGLQQLMALAAAARAHFKAAGLLLQADQPFVPHVTIAKTSKLQGWGRQGHGRSGGGRGHGRGHAPGGGRHERNDWRADRREERRAKQQRLEMQAADEEALAGMGWGLEGEQRSDDGSGGGKGAAGPALLAAGAPAEGDSEAAAVEASAAAAVPPASATEPPSRSTDYDTSGAAAAVAAGAAAAGAGGAEPLAEDEPQRSQQAQQGQHGGRKRQHEGEGAADPPAHHSGGSWRQIDAEAWAQHAAIQGGSVLLGEVQLCSMQGRKPEDYYPVLCSLALAPAEAAAGAAAAAPTGGGQAGATSAVQVEGVAAAAGILGPAADAGPATQPAAAPGSVPEAAAQGR